MSEKCVKCSEVFECAGEYIKCCDCNDAYHPGCCRIRTMDSLKRLGANRRAAWKCDSCKQDTTSSRSDTDVATDSNIMGVLRAIRKDMAENMKESVQRFVNLEESIQGIKDVVADFKQKIHALEEENTLLKNQCEENKNILVDTKKELSKMRVELLDLQQYSRRHNIEVKGVPCTPRENVYLVLEAIAKVLGVPTSRGDFSVAHRLPRPPAGHPTIIAAFISRTTKEMWLTAAKKTRITSTDIFPRLEPEPVYVNSHLTGHNKQLLGRAKQLVRSKKLAAAWTVDGRVIVRKAEGERAVRIWAIEDLDCLMAK